MKLTLEFPLPQEQAEADLAFNAGKWYSLLWDVDNKIRNALKYGHKYKSADDALKKIREFIYQEMAEEGISFDR